MPGYNEKTLDRTLKRFKELNKSDTSRSAKLNRALKNAKEKIDLNKFKKEKFKKGGRAGYKAGASVGGLNEVDSKKNPGLAKLPTEVRNKMGYLKKGGRVGKKVGGRIGKMGGGMMMMKKRKPLKKGGKAK